MDYEGRRCKNKIVLVNFPAKQYRAGKEEEIMYGYNPSFSLNALGTWLDFHGYDVKLIDLLTDHMDKKDFMEVVTSEDILFLGISIHTESVNISLQSIREIKKIRRDLVVVVGGAHSSLCPEDMLKEKSIDFVSINEGEGTLLELAEALKTKEEIVRFEDIPNLAYRKDGETVYTSPRHVITDMDIFPMPKRELFDIQRYQQVINMLSGRGCPGCCVYCAATVLSGKKYRARSIENVFLEIVLLKYLFGDKVIKFFFVDDTFTVSKKRVLQFAQYIKQYHINFEWSCQSRVDHIDNEMIDAMAETGCNELMFGIESGNQEVLYKIGKNIKLDQALKVLSYTNMKKIHIQCSFILGHYCDTKATMEETYRLAYYIYENYHADIVVYFNTPYPGTWQYINRDRVGLRIIEKNYSNYTNLNPIVETDDFTIEDQIFYRSKFLNFFMRAILLEKEKRKLLQEVKREE